ncbi:MAG: GGDEF domain-containing protein [Deltaproteobacteria bacterium]|nr:MAG: GGDEF domain-containing protein [Deltaproteobacteria bacterium]
MDDTDSQEKTQVVRTDVGAPAGAEACLVAVSGGEIGRRYRLHNVETRLGRSPNADIVVEEQGVSRLHACVLRKHNGTVIRDLESTNGTVVNGVSVREQRLEDGDTVRIGKAVFKFLERNNLESAYYDEIYRLTTIDDLTRIANRRHFFTTFERELSRSLRHDRDLAIVMFDIDRFKLLNDTYGHTAGDAVLTQVAERVSSLCREEDLFARYGGEEFALLLPETEQRAAGSLARRIRIAIAEKPFPVDSWKLDVTVSLGVADIAEFRERHDLQNARTATPELVNQFIRIADEKLYTAKELGRNRVVL